MDTITKERVMELFVYSDKHHGLLYRQRNPEKMKKMHREVGSRAGYTHSRGYRHVAVDGVIYKEHILIWIYFNGSKDSSLQIDHKNKIRDDNRIDNLRIGTGFQNQQNRGRNKNNSSGYKGVHKREGKWHVSIMCNRKTYRFGCFDCPKEAAMVYNKEVAKLHGEFANLNIIV